MKDQDRQGTDLTVESGRKDKPERGLRGRRREGLCRDLRVQQTPAEQVFWEMVRDRRIDGMKFRRQHPVGTFVADFYCPEARLDVEIDGDVHRDPNQAVRDMQRADILDSLGIRVLRLTNDEVLTDQSATASRLRAYLSPSPSADGEGARG